jgi:4-hydroxybenzoate polyprenyltransferase
MFETIKLFGIVSRAEFILPNLGSLIMGLAWGFTPPMNFTDLAVLVVLSFAVINISSAIGAQTNTISDYELDKEDQRKKRLVQAEESLGPNKLKNAVIMELLLTLALVSLFMWIQGKPILLVMWIAGISLGCAYSVPPLRLKSRSWLAPISLILVLAVFPVLFAYFTFTSEITPFFLLSLIGLALTVYGVIIPTEIRDYFGDKNMNIETMTVHLGLVKASFLSMALLVMGAILIGTAFLLEFAYGHYPWLNVLLLAVPIAVSIVLGKFKKLHSLSKEYVHLNGQSSIAEEIVRLSVHNPQWIMLITQTYSILSIVLLLSKILY